MIENLAGLPLGVTGLRVDGRLSATDYEQVVTPAVVTAMRSGGRLRCLIEVEHGFRGLTPSAVVDDVQLGLHAVGAFDGVAVVGGPDWVTASTRWAACFVPFPLRVFAPGERDAAAAWLADLSAGAGVTVTLDGGVVTAEVTRALRIEDFEALSAEVDPWMREHGELPGLVLHLRGLPHWTSIGSVVRHIRFVLGHQGKINRLALVTDIAVADAIASLADHAVHPEVRAFAYTDLVAAQAWAAGS